MKGEPKMNKPITHVLPGFMELLPNEQLAFNRIKRIISEEYQSYGFTPLDTPVIERSETLLAKAGGETEKQIYRFDKGDTDLSLRFDLTVPLARYVAEHFNQLTFPFKRYQIDKVYRGESPQKGRFREFYQCDIDVIGHDSLDTYYDAEIPSVIYSIFSRLDFGKFTISVNNRKILNGLMESLGAEDKSAEALRIIDKIEKVPEEETIGNLESIGLSSNQIKTLMSFISIKGNTNQILSSLRKLNISSEDFLVGVDELETVVKMMILMGIKKDYFKIDLSIARGLDYYTGTVYETRLNDYPQIGSVCSGGRYDNLASYYIDEKLPGVGISIGLTRLFYQLNEIGIIEKTQKTASDVLIIPIGEVEKSLMIAGKIRQFGLNVDVLLQEMPIKKQFKYANKIGVRYVIVVGEDEAKTDVYTLQNMLTRERKTMSIEEIGVYFKR